MEKKTGSSQNAHAVYFVLCLQLDDDSKSCDVNHAGELILNDEQVSRDRQIFDMLLASFESIEEEASNFDEILNNIV